MKKCPHCQAEKFKLYIKKGALAQFDDDGEALVLKEGASFEALTDDIVCAACGVHMTFEELSSKIACVSCKILYPLEELNDEGKCELCLLKEKLSGTTQEDLFKLILDLQHKTGEKGLQIEKKLEKAEETVKKIEEKKEAADAKAEAKAEEPPKEKPKRKSRAKAATAETPAEEAVEEEDVQVLESELGLEKTEPLVLEDPADIVEAIVIPVQEPAQEAVEAVPGVVNDVEDIFKDIPLEAVEDQGTTDPFDNLPDFPEPEFAF